MADTKPTLEPTEWQREIAEKAVDNYICEASIGIAETRHGLECVFKAAIIEACARQGEENAKIAEQYKYDALTSEFALTVNATSKAIAAAIRRNRGK